MTRTVTLRKMREWLEGGSKSPNEKVEKERLKRLIDCDRDSSVRRERNSDFRALITLQSLVRQIPPRPLQR